MQGWGAINKTSHEIVSGIWSDKEKDAHINVLEMKAAYLALQHFLFFHGRYSYKVVS